MTQPVPLALLQRDILVLAGHGIGGIDALLQWSSGASLLRDVTPYEYETGGSICLWLFKANSMPFTSSWPMCLHVDVHTNAQH